MPDEAGQALRAVDHERPLLIYNIAVRTEFIEAPDL